MLKKVVRIEVDPEEYTDQYDEMLNEVHGEFMGMDASYILKECDPTAYRCGLLDYVDSYASDIFECPICEEQYDDEDDALFCCQDEDEENDESEDEE